MLPYTYKKNLLLTGLYGKVLPAVQQESTFWDDQSHRRIDFNKLRTLKLAGDYYLWTVIVRDTSLFIVCAWLSGFKVHDGQLSSKFHKEYYREVDSLSNQPSMIDYIVAHAHKIVWRGPNKFKKYLSRELFIYDSIHKEYKLSNKK